ncbi:P-loop containing nucleoside triphosphate hydrolase protein [Hyaloraphidium curvatum]|nr:P-loop containing nucleoside triphosphate hydrolase protein [Hyaloraphidium curvatum]
MAPVRVVEPIKVAVRVRPALGGEDTEGCVVVEEDGKVVLHFPSNPLVPPSPSQAAASAGTGVPGGTASKRFAYDRAFGPDAGQERVYAEHVAEVVDGALEGWKGTIIAYGATGSGKTRTILGDAADLAALLDDSCPFAVGDALGIVPRAVRDVFHGFELRGIRGGAVGLSYLEIYNEELLDLLHDPSAGPPPALSITSLGPSPSVTNLSQELHSHPRTLLRSIVAAAARRRQRATDRNAQSSRGHTWCVLEALEPRHGGEAARREDYFQLGKLQFLDLAGSENVARSGVQGQGVREAGSINKSLVALGRVIQALNRSEPHVPWRDGCVTRLLQDSLGGTALTAFIACVGGDGRQASETFNTLAYAAAVRRIENRPQRGGEYVKNVEHAAGKVAQLRTLVEERDATLAQYAARVALLEGEVRRLAGELRAEREENAERARAARAAVSTHAASLSSLLEAQLASYMERFNAAVVGFAAGQQEIAGAFAGELGRGVEEGLQVLRIGVQNNDEEALDDAPLDPLADLPALPPLPDPLTSDTPPKTPTPPRSPVASTPSQNPLLFSPTRKPRPAPATPSGRKTPGFAFGTGTGRKPPLALATPRGVLKPNNAEEGTPSKKRKFEAGAAE